MGIWYDNAYVGPASYATGGFSVSTGLSAVENARIEIITPGANLGRVEFDLSFSGGNITVKVMRRVYDKLTALGDLTNLPSGISARTTSGGAYDAVSHTHNLDHDHAAATSATPTAAGAGVATAVGGTNMSTHTHSFNVPNFTGVASGAEAAHAHTWDEIYEHQHSLTNTATNLAVAELANGTDLSGATLMITAVGTE